MDDSLDEIKRRGNLKIGVSLGLLGLSEKNENLEWSGFDIDLAKCMSAAIFDDPNKIEFIPLTSKDRFKSVSSGLVDVGMFNSSITFNREIVSEVKFCHPMLFDCEMLLSKKINAANKYAISGTRIAAIDGSTTKENLMRFFNKNNINAEVVLFNDFESARKSYEDDKCQYYCLDSYLLAGEKYKLNKPEDHCLVDYIISREAMSPVTSSRKSQLTNALTWVLRSIIESEELGLTSNNIRHSNSISSGYVYQFLNPSEDICENLGLVEGFTNSIVDKVGNYSEIFERNLGLLSKLKQPRRENHLRSNGGMLYPPLFI